MKLRKKDYIHIAIAIGLYLAMVLVITKFRYAYGSRLDWSSQHFAIPDIFRRQFYETGELFPSFVFNLGAGENIYDLSYYGLFSPIIMLSYLFPFVPMYIYIQIASILSVCVSILLFYRWTNGKFGSQKAFVLTLMFEFSTSFSFHSHRHIMFVSYMPFLLLAFGAVDNYFKGKRKFSLVIYTFLCIMCCYFFSVSAVAAIAVYGVYEYLRTTEKVTLKDFWKKGSHFAGRLFTAVLMAGILLLPTFYCLLGSRDPSGGRSSLFRLLPNVDISFLCYDTYGMGLTIAAVIAVISAVASKNKKHTRFLGITMLCLMCLPAIVYLLNGALYVDSKVLIPFMPLCLLLVGRLFEQAQDKSFNFRLCHICVIALVIAFWLFDRSVNYLYRRQQIRFLMKVDITVTLLIALAYIIFKNKRIMTIGAAAIAVAVGFTANRRDRLEEMSRLEYLHSEDFYTLTQTISDDGDLVRAANLVDRGKTPNYIYGKHHLVSTVYSSLHNRRYNRFYFSRIRNENEFRNTALTAQSQSFVYQMFMGTKYLITDDSAEPPFMYKKVKQSGDLSLYECDMAMPLAYCSPQVLDEQAFLDIPYPYSLSALMNNIIVTDGGSDSYKCDTIKETAGFEISTAHGITKTKDGYSVRLKSAADFTVKLKEPIQPDKLLLIAFDVDNDLSGKGLSSGDAKIFINGIMNNLTNPNWKYYNGNTTFEYVISPHDDKAMTELKMRFMRGNYDISNIRCYTMDMPQTDNVDKFSFDKQKTRGDDIVGSIDVTKDGYFMLTVPYADGFAAYVDGEKTQVECVDTAFVGFPLKQGHHEIKITFTAPLRNEGLLMSAGGVLILAILVFFEYPPKRKKKEVKSNEYEK